MFGALNHGFTSLLQILFFFPFFRLDTWIIEYKVSHVLTTVQKKDLEIRTVNKFETKVRVLINLDEHDF